MISVKLSGDPAKVAQELNALILAGKQIKLLKKCKIGADFIVLYV